jgi:hypothetical protein
MLMLQAKLQGDPKNFLSSNHTSIKKSQNDHQHHNSIHSEFDKLHEQYLREKPLLEEIRLLRAAKEDAERRLELVETEN